MDPEIKALVQNEELLTPLQKKIIAHIEEREARVTSFIQDEINKAIQYINHCLFKRPLRISKYPSLDCRQYQEIKDYISAETDKYFQESINKMEKVAKESFDECMGRGIDDVNNDHTLTQEELFYCGFRYEVDRSTVFHAVTTNALNNLPKTTRDKRKRVINLIQATLLMEMAFNREKIVGLMRKSKATSLDYFETVGHKLNPYDRDLWELFSVMECCLYSPRGGSEKLLEYVRSLALKNQELNQQLVRINTDIQAKEVARKKASSKGGKNGKITPDHKKIKEATEYFKEHNWITPLDVELDYLDWRKEKSYKRISPSTAKRHIHLAINWHKQGLL